MLRILALAYYFPPLGGAGVQRNLRLVEHLAQQAHELIVVTGPGTTGDRWAPSDVDLAGVALDGIDVHRLQRVAEPPAGGRRARLDRYLGVRHPWSAWWSEEVFRAGAPLAERCDLVWALMQPYGSAEPAARIARHGEIPWVADLADPWALDEMLVYPTRFHRRLEERRMRRALQSAAGIVMSTTEAARRLERSLPELGDKPVAVGPVGWEPSDFAGPASTRTDGAFRIVHTGYLHTELGMRQERTRSLRRVLGGDRDNVRIITRSHLFLVRALELLLAERPDLRESVELHLAGVATDADRSVRPERLKVQMHGYLDHSRSVALLRSADLLFLPMHDLPPGVRAGLVPGKTYEYLASGRPILAAVPDGDARDLLARAGNALLCRPDDVGAMKALLEEQIDAWLEHRPEPTPRAEVRDPFRYDCLARELAEFFETVVQRPARAPDGLSVAQGPL